MQKLSIIIPVFNEQATIYDVLVKVNDVELVQGIQKEIIVVNDKSSDESAKEVERYLNEFPSNNVQFINHEVNKGKGGALHTGIKNATGEYTIIQDADLELDPNEYNIIIAPVLDQSADVVYGSRFLNQKMQGSKMGKAANAFLTNLSNVVFGTNITDMETCYKLVPTPIFQSLNLVEQRFGFEPEITAKLAKLKHLKWQEVPITYIPRTNEEGKKIGWKDGFRAIYCILKYGWFTSKKSSVNRGLGEYQTTK
ncbi:glycosyltransferase family 2 protein [Parvicella tangerina]|uniref:glycosyltransferase family 2 protein n=1 Tax=Parvicella tangerina TaxID=2829795 RepID=UPI00215C315A|nr:glycosyltransferase family 2 protein [Parvicella tangerina]